MKCFCAALICCLPNFTSAQALLDPEAVMEQNAELVFSTTEDGVLSRTLDLPPNSHIERIGPIGEAECVGMDTSEFGALGCVLMIANEARQGVMACPNLMAGEGFSKLDSITRRLAGFIATNAVPPLSSSDVESLLRRSGLPRNLDCQAIEAIPETAMFVEFGRHLIDEVEEKGFDGVFGPARLPMMNPFL